MRLMPLPEATVCGTLSRGMAVEVWACNGLWLQIRYENNSCAWVLKESGDRTLLARLDNAIQRRIGLTFTNSPCTIPASLLVLREEDIDGDALLEVGSESAIETESVT